MATDSAPIVQTAASGLDVFLDRQHEQILDGRVEPAVRQVVAVLDQYHGTVSGWEWRTCLQPICLRHPLRHVLHEDPLTRRAYQKPRGYAGDAVLLDYLYSAVPPPGTTALGRRIFSTNVQARTAFGVLARRDFLAAQVDEMAATRRRPRILSVACGHLREAQQSRAVQAGEIGAYYALDQDAESLAVVEQEQADLGITPVHATVKMLLSGQVSFEDLDFVYAAGLYNYLSDDVATLLTAALFEMVAPGGKLLLASHLPDSPGRGYMETFMDWYLIYRDVAQLERLICQIPGNALAASRSFCDRYGKIAFLECTRSGG